jgi:hypothetical protein
VVGSEKGGGQRERWWAARKVVGSEKGGGQRERQWAARKVVGSEKGGGQRERQWAARKVVGSEKGGRQREKKGITERQRLVEEAICLGCIITVHLHITPAWKRRRKASMMTRSDRGKCKWIVDAYR